MRVRGSNFRNRPFRSKLISFGKPSLPLHNGLVDYFYVSVLHEKSVSFLSLLLTFFVLQVTSSGAIVFLKSDRYMFWHAWYDNYLYDRYYHSMCPYGCYQHCSGRYYYWYWNWKCYICRRLCQRTALFPSPLALSGLISDPVCDPRFRQRSNIFPIHGVFFPMWTYNFVYRQDVRYYLCWFGVFRKNIFSYQRINETQIHVKKWKSLILYLLPNVNIVKFILMFTLMSIQVILSRVFLTLKFMTKLEFIIFLYFRSKLFIGPMTICRYIHKESFNKQYDYLYSLSLPFFTETIYSPTHYLKIILCVK